MKRLVSVILVALLAGLGVWGYFYAQSGGNAPKYRTARVERGSVTAAVSASGNLAAVTTVQVGSQVSGQVKELFADFNSLVKRNQIIARIDPAIFEAKVNQARADVDSAQAAVLNQSAQVERARADVENARAALAEARAQTAKSQVAVAEAARDLERKMELFRRDLISKSERDTSQAAQDSAAAQVDSSRAKEQALAAAILSAAAQLRVTDAMLQAARANVKHKQAALQQAQVDLDHTTIRAPVNGVVVARSVDVGQTVAASLQAPVLFTIAQDLTKMQVETSVDEADIGRITLDDRASFTVDAFPGQGFTGTVRQIRKAALVVQNVVTYTVVIGVDNPGGRLLPGMTANVKMIVAEKPSVLKVPNAALRFRLAGADGAPAAAPRGQPAAGAARGGDGRGGGAGRPTPEDIRDRLVTGLTLTAEQQAKLDPILEESRQQMQTLGAAPEAERGERAARIREASRARIRALLTPEQQQRYDRIAAERSVATPGRVYVVDAEGKAAAVSLTLGISDGTATEVLRGNLVEGQEVVVGLASGG
ncbi:MAG: efflux RND transporter periplasmic adaptor subunit, partial [Candidatus Rokuibacteriota bacterium]